MFSVLKKISDFAGTRRGLLKKSMAVAFLGAVFAALQFAALMLTLDILVGGADLRIWPVIGVMVVSVVGRAACSYWSTNAETETGYFMVAEKRIHIGDRLRYIPMGYFNDNSLGNITAVVTTTLSDVENNAARCLVSVIGGFLNTLGLCLGLTVADWRLGLLSLAPVALGFLIMMAMTGPRMQQKMKEYQDALDDMSNEAVEYVRGIPVVKTFGQTIFSFKKFKDSIDRYKVWVIAYTKQLRLPMMCYTAAINGVFAFLTAGALVLTRDGVTPEFLLNLLFYIIITPIISVTLTRIMFQSENAMIVDDALQRIDSVLNLAPLPEPARPREPRDGSVELSDVCFRYGGGPEVLRHVTLSIPAGTTAAFVGPSGGGKTTLAQLIARFFDPQSGVIRIGGVDVRDIAKETLMDTVSFVFQDSRLIKASILDNVRLGRPEATREEVLAALRSAQCGDILEKLPQGVDTVIGSKGVYLSGGEQQRIAIARVMLKNTPVIILDEATAFADPDNEARVQAAFARLAEGKTVLMIAHRLSTVAHVDQIFVVEEGRIAEHGSYDQLLARDGLFRRLWDNYQTSTQWKVAKEG